MQNESFDQVDEGVGGLFVCFAKFGAGLLGGVEAAVRAGATPIHELVCEEGFGLLESLVWVSTCVTGGFGESIVGGFFGGNVEVVGCGDCFSECLGPGCGPASGPPG